MKESFVNLEYYKVVTQEADCCSDASEQTIEITTKNGGGGDFVRISTEEWAVESKDEWIKLWDEHISPVLKLVDDHNKKYQSINNE